MHPVSSTPHDVTILQQGYSFRQKLGFLLGPFLFFTVAFLLLRTGLAPKASWAGATVALMACWWITEPIPLWATACIPILIFPLVGAASFHGVILQYLDPVNFLFMGGMFIAASMQQWGLHRRIALNIVSAIGTSPRRIVLGFMLATTFITLWITNTAAAMMMFPIGMAVVTKFEEQTGRNNPLLQQFGLALMLGIAYAASIGGIGTKIGTGTNLVFVKQAADLLQKEIDFLTWLKMGLPIVIIVIPLVWFYLVRFAAKLPASEFPGAREAIEDAKEKLGSMSKGETVALIAFLTAAFLWIFRKDIELGFLTVPGWWDILPFGWPDFIGRPVSKLPSPLNKLLSDVGDACVAVIIGTALLIIPIQRRPLHFALGLKNAAGISWSLLILLGGGFAMAYGIQESGLSNTMAQLLKGMGKVDPLTATIVVCFLSVALTEVASNTATASILLPLLAASAQSFGLEPIPLMFAATIAASFGFMLPAGTPPNAIVFSSGYITVPQMARSGLAVDLAGAIIVGVICYFLTPLVLGAR